MKLMVKFVIGLSCEAQPLLGHICHRGPAINLYPKVPTAENSL